MIKALQSFQYNIVRFQSELVYARELEENTNERNQWALSSLTHKISEHLETKQKYFIEITVARSQSKLFQVVTELPNY